MLNRDKNFRSAFVLAVAVPIVCAATAALVLRNIELIPTIFPACKIKRLTGLNCASCGATRSTLALLRGDIKTAFWYNPMYIAFLCWLGYLYTRLVVSLAVRPYRRYVPKIDVWKAVAIGIIIAAFMIIRNMPFYQAIFF